MMRARSILALLALAAALAAPAAALGGGRAGPGEFVEAPPCYVDDAGDEVCDVV